MLKVFIPIVEITVEKVRHSIGKVHQWTDITGIKKDLVRF